ncbi:MAG: hypothetical protein ACPGO3_10620 [Magnetospiraceae bacterium]
MNPFRRRKPDPFTPHHKRALGFMMGHLLVGTLGGFAFGGLLLFFDVGGLGTLVFESSEPALALFLLFFGLFVTFGSIGMAAGVMSQGQERD